MFLFSEGSPYRGILSSGILYLQESQQLQVMKDKWWKAEVKCPDDSGLASAEMGIRNVGGVFLVLGIGSCLGIIIVVLEFAWKANKMMDRVSVELHVVIHVIFFSDNLFVIYLSVMQDVPKFTEQTLGCDKKQFTSTNHHTIYG